MKYVLLKFSNKITYLATTKYECYLYTEGHTASVKAHIFGTLHVVSILFIYFVQILGFNFLVVICTNIIHDFFLEINRYTEP
jgi:hypothetical protein